MVRPYFRKKQEEAKALYHELKGTGKTSNVLSEILKAAHHGRISELFVTPGIQQWGSYDSESEEMTLHDAPVSDSEDLYDLAAAKTFLNNGNVFVVEAEELPDETTLAAIYRW